MYRVIKITQLAYEVGMSNHNLKNHNSINLCNNFCIQKFTNVNHTNHNHLQKLSNKHTEQIKIKCLYLDIYKQEYQ